MNNVNMSSSLLKLAATEINNNKNELSIYYKILSEKIILIIASFNQRNYHETSCTMPCGFQLHNNSSSGHEAMRKSILFVLLPDKKTFFDARSK